MPKTKKVNPLFVIVTDGRYDMFGVPNLKNRWLAQLLKNMGGISDTVKPGTYVFDAKFTLKGLVTSLESAEEV